MTVERHLKIAPAAITRVFNVHVVESGRGTRKLLQTMSAGRLSSARGVISMSIRGKTRLCPFFSLYWTPPLTILHNV